MTEISNLTRKHIFLILFLFSFVFIIHQFINMSMSNLFLTLFNLFSIFLSFKLDTFLHSFFFYLYSRVEGPRVLPSNSLSHCLRASLGHTNSQALGFSVRVLNGAPTQKKVTGKNTVLNIWKADHCKHTLCLLYILVLPCLLFNTYVEVVVKVQVVKHLSSRSKTVGSILSTREELAQPC